ncbi:fimbrial biogenesis chaperone [Burkholderia lata]|uniref:Pilus assembly protein n=1 Tax=Burkholderia lata (strain ATCC 17760 / DSM 23089 / LMG 22485 / NCIMB 9086 / R18194 / 383) TaxID=482957 RepID=A0A6P2SW47_BURL3|nr:fimbria/pilus periplasmic chaperone [Burkholderia lata]VWC53653.1 pilus assembly protein [Burkholderia lata]
MTYLKSIRLLACLLMAVTCQAKASVVISGTRVIFPAKEQEVTVQMTNEGKAPSVVQAWVTRNEQDTAPEQADVPFLLMPSTFRLDPGKGQALRLVHTDDTLPSDKESLFWLNVLDIPPKAADDDRSKIQFAFRTRIKMMYRPSNLPGSADDAPGQVEWELARDGSAYAINAINPTPYVVNLGNIALTIDGQKYDAGAGYILPGATQTFPVNGLHANPVSGAEVEFSSINDWGASKDARKSVRIR